MCDSHYDPRKLKGIPGFTDELMVAMVNQRIYWNDHPRVKSAIDHLGIRLKALLEEGKAGALHLKVIDGYLVHDGKPLLGPSISSNRFIEIVTDLEAGGISFSEGAREGDFASLLQVLGKAGKNSWNWEEANKELEKNGCENIRFLDQTLEEGVQDEGTPSSGKRVPRRMVSLKIYQGVIDYLQNMTVSICRGTQFDIQPAKTQIEGILKKLDSDTKSMMNMVRYEQYDAFTFGHSIRVCFLTLNFCRSLTSDQEILNRMGTAALLHDIGKAKVPFEVLHSRSRLTVDERREMEKHTRFGAEILLDMESPDPLTVAAAFGHHRTRDGKGYPKLDESVPLSLATRVIKICDVYEALTAVRPYKPSMSPLRAFRIMISMGNHFDMALLRRFIEVNGIYPVGTLVELSTGETVVVEAQNPDLSRPRVTFETTPDGDPLAEEDRKALDLQAHHEVSIRRRVVEEEAAA